MLFEFIRGLTCPFNEVEKYVPKKGKILDMGCGHGIFSKLLVEKSKKRFVLGIDPSDKKILEASKKSVLKNLKFKKAYIDDIKEKFDAISIIDVTYLLPQKEKLKIFKKAKELLKKGGRLILVENGYGDSFIYKLLKLQETIMVKFFRFTYSGHEGLHFLTNEGYRKLLKKSGFTVKVEKKITSFLPYPHTIFVAAKN